MSKVLGSILISLLFLLVSSSISYAETIQLNSGQFGITLVELEKVDALGKSAEDQRSFRIQTSDPVDKIRIAIWEYPNTSIITNPYTEYTFSGNETLRTFYVSPGGFDKKLKPHTSYIYRITAWKRGASTDMNMTYGNEFTTIDFSTENSNVNNISNIKNERSGNISVQLNISKSLVSAGESIILTWSVENADICKASGGWSGEKNSKSGSETIMPKELYALYSLDCHNNTSQQSAMVDVTVSTNSIAPKIDFFKTDKTSIKKGEQIIITWKTDAQICQSYVDILQSDGSWSWDQDNEWAASSGERNPSGSIRAQPVQTTQYWLNCFNNEKQTNRNIIIVVDKKRPKLEGVPIYLSKVKVTSQGDELVKYFSYDFGYIPVDGSLIQILTITKKSSGEIVQKKDVSYDNKPWSTVTISGLEPDVEYHYALHLEYPADNRIADTEGDFKTENNNDLEDIQNNEEQAPYLVFIRYPDQVTKGKKATLRWESDADYCIASGAWKGKKADTGNFVVYPKRLKETYYLQCFIADGRKTSKEQITVTVVKKLPTKNQSRVTINLSAEQATIQHGERVTISWNAVNAMNCEGFGPDEWVGLQYVKGSQDVAPDQTEIYSLKCWDRYGQSSFSKVTIQVVEEKEQLQPSSELQKEESITQKPQQNQLQEIAPQAPQEQKKPQPSVSQQPVSQAPQEPQTVVVQQPQQQTPPQPQLISTPLPAPDCDTTPETFKTTGIITCGRITWKLHPVHAALLSGDPRGYLMLYDRLYGTLKEMLAYEPKEKKMEIMEQCPPKGGISCPNGKMGWDYPMYVLGGNVVYITSDFFENYFWMLANNSEHPISASIQHEMGHIFTASQDAKYAYLWDESFIEKFASVWGNMGAHVVNEIYGTNERYYWDAWCRAKGKSINTCIDSYTTLDDWASLGSDADWKAFIVNPKAVGNVYPYTLDMIIQLYREFKKQGKAEQFYQGFKNTFRYYNSEFPLPLAWRTPDIKNQSQDIVSAKSSFFAFLLSYFTKTDLLQKFETWGYPISQEIKDAYARTQQSGFDAEVFKKIVQDLTSPQTTYTGTGTGLAGSYYDTINSYYDINPSSLTLTRIDSRIDFDWQLSAPDARMGYDTFGVKWTGKIEAPLTGTYTFSAIGDDGVRLWVNGQKIIDDWNVHAPKENSGTITLETGKKYDIAIEYFDEFYGAEIHLFWTPPGKKKELIPASQLYAQ